MADQIREWKELAAQLRVDSIRCTTAAGSGHPTSSLSAADLMAVLLSKYLHYDWAEPRYANNDRLIFSKGHACPLLYAMFKAAGAISDRELLSLRKLGSRLEGHPNPRMLPFVTSRPARSARVCPSASAWRSTPSASTSSPIESGWFWAIAKSPRAPSGKHSTRPGITSSTTWSRFWT